VVNPALVPRSKIEQRPDRLPGTPPARALTAEQSGDVVAVEDSAFHQGRIENYISSVLTESTR